MDFKKSRFWIFILVLWVLLALLTIVGDIMDTNRSQDLLLNLLIIPLAPGYFIYILITGDIHGTIPGPIGQIGRIIVSTIGNWMFWTPITYWIYRKLRNLKI